MKWFKFLFFGVLHIPLFSVGNDPAFIEKQRIVQVNYPLPKGNSLSITNQFGDIKIVYWNKEATQLQIRISAESPQEDMALALLQQVQILHAKTDQGVSVQTKFHRPPAPPEKGKRTSLRVDYVVQVPRDAELVLTNSFGDIYMPDHAGKLTISQEYGKLFANHLSGPDTHLKVAYGQALIKSLQGGQMKASYSQVVLDEVTRSELNNSFGDLHVKIARDVRGVVSYSSGLIDQIKESAAWQVNYANKFKINQVDAKSGRIQIQSAYSPVEIPNGQYNFEVRLQNGEFSYQGAREVTVEQAPFPSKSKQPIRVYMGKVGPDSPVDTKVMINSRFGQVKIKP